MQSGGWIKVQQPKFLHFLTLLGLYNFMQLGKISYLRLGKFWVTLGGAGVNISQKIVNSSRIRMTKTNVKYASLDTAIMFSLADTKRRLFANDCQKGINTKTSLNLKSLISATASILGSFIQLGRFSFDLQFLIRNSSVWTL